MQGSSPSSSVINTVDNSTVAVEGVEEQSSSSAAVSTTLVIVISVVGVVIILLLLVTIVGILGCVITQRRMKMMLDRRHCSSGDDMLMSVNTVYGSDVMTIKPTSISANDDTHIYSEIRDVMKTPHYVLTSKQNQCYSVIPPLKDQEKKGKEVGEEKKDKDKGGKEDDEWIPNPTYQLAPISNNNNNIPPPTPTCIIGTSVDHDDEREDKVSVEVCPAYGSASPHPLVDGEGEVGGTEKVVYEDLNHIV